MSISIQRLFLKASISSIVLCVLMTIDAYGQYSIESYGGVRGLSMGQTGVNTLGANGQFVNPASIAFSKDVSASLSSERRFESSGIHQIGLSLAKSIPSLGSLGLIIQQVGVESYNQAKLGVTYARLLTDMFAVGVQFNAHQLKIDEYGSSTIINATIGMRTTLNDQISVGLVVQNPIPNNVLADEELPLIFILGMDFRPTEKVSVVGEIEKDVDFPVNVKVGLEYLPIRRFALRLGINSEPAAVHLGAGFQITTDLWIDAGMTYNQELGISPGLGISFR